jgi:hypothetical protein
MEISFLKEDLIKIKGKANDKKVEVTLDLGENKPWEGKIPKSDILISQRIKKEITFPFLINIQGEYEKNGVLIKYFIQKSQKSFEIKLEDMKIVGILSEREKFEESKELFSGDIFILKGKKTFVKKAIQELEGKIFIPVLSPKEKNTFLKEMRIKKENLYQKLKIKKEDILKKRKEIALLV